MSSSISSRGSSYASRIKHIEQSPSGVMLLWLHLIDEFDHLHMPGQYLQLQLNEEWSFFSIASLPCAKSPLELHIQTQDQEKIQFLLNAFAEQSLLQIRYAFGVVSWPVELAAGIFLCRGTGFAPAKALIESGLARNGDREIHLYWESDNPKDFYFEAWLKRILFSHAHFKVTLLCPIAMKVSLSHARLRVEQKPLLESVLANDLKCKAWLYLCASPARVHEWAQALEAAGAPAHHMSSDVFEYAPRASS